MPSSGPSFSCTYVTCTRTHIHILKLFLSLDKNIGAINFRIVTMSKSQSFKPDFTGHFRKEGFNIQEWESELLVEKSKPATPYIA